MKSALVEIFVALAYVLTISAMSVLLLGVVCPDMPLVKDLLKTIKGLG